MEESINALPDDISKQLQLWSEIRKSHELLNKHRNESKETIYMLKNMLKSAHDSEKHQAILRQQAESIVIKQSKIISGLMSVREENTNLKKQIEDMKENLKKQEKETDDERISWGEELTSTEAKFKEEIKKQAEMMRAELEEERRKWVDTKKRMEQDLQLLKQSLQSQLHEKNLVMEVTVREYEEQLNSTRRTLDDIKKQKQLLEKRNNSNIEAYNKKMEDQEKHYITMLEKVKREVATTSQTLDSQNYNKVLKKVQFQKPIITSYSQFCLENQEKKPDSQQISSIPYYPPISKAYINDQTAPSSGNGNSYRNRLGISDHRVQKDPGSIENTTKEFPISKRRKLYNPDYNDNF